MSLIHKESFDVLDNCEQGKENEYFEVDENIALIISMLNKKGYKTTYCCSGHAFDGITELYAEDKSTFDCLIFSNLQDIRYENGRYKAVDRGNTKSCYIIFEKDYAFLELPEGFTYDKNDKRIEKEYMSESDSYDLIIEIVDSMRELYEWTNELKALV